jgi:hypothetical protein
MVEMAERKNPPKSPFTKGENVINSLLRKRRVREDLSFFHFC